MGRLDGKVCIVTGASGGIGAKTAEFYGREGAKVVLAARRENYLNAVAKKVRDAGGEALVVVTDIRDKAQAEALVEKTVETFGRLDVLCNVAGYIEAGLRPVDVFTDEEMETIVDTNLKGTLYVTRAATRVFTRQGVGNVIMVSSVSALTGNGAGVYTATKGALVALTKHIAMRYANKKPTVRANCVCPGTVWTDMCRRELAAQEGGQYCPEAQEFNETVGKHGCADVGISKAVDIANVLVFLASDESACLNGQVLALDYGCTL
ncbi:MAG: SDR family oxidoreductase [Oscillospiraceae bacterium]|nr:SDR family oxidoreductase [Oscillospiraceae bacterium]MDD6503088.1 SDR family NAD(P)-dependent oxidoreductase [Oscillospiraceae bacterium]MDY4105798.1 SDR family NAD(P)-dependent oxidoreductase [Oscillospiraceae bacterium]